jgi:hypothetical protein
MPIQGMLLIRLNRQKNENMSEDIIPIPRVESRAPNKNTIEWEIPDKVSVCFMLVERAGYTFVAKVKVKKKYWWSFSHKTFVVCNSNPMEVIIKGLEFLEQYGYYIDDNTIEFGETIGVDKKT